jgi:hypothetical protein
LLAHLLFSQLTKPSRKKQKSHQADAQRHCKMTRQLTTEKEERTANKVLPKAGVKCFYDTFVLHRTLVFQINSSAEMPRLRQYPNRKVQADSTTVTPPKNPTDLS